MLGIGWVVSFHIAFFLSELFANLVVSYFNFHFHRIKTRTTNSVFSVGTRTDFTRLIVKPRDCNKSTVAFTFSSHVEKVCPPR